MDRVKTTFRTGKLASTALWTLGVTALASVLGSGVSNAQVVCPTDPITTTGGSTLLTAAAIGPVCGNTTISGDQTFPGYWEFTWDGAATSTAVGASVTQNNVIGSFQGDLALYSSNDDLIESADLVGSYLYSSPATGSLGYAFTPERSTTLASRAATICLSPLPSRRPNRPRSACLAARSQRLAGSAGAGNNAEPCAEFRSGDASARFRHHAVLQRRPHARAGVVVGALAKPFQP